MNYYPVSLNLKDKRCIVVGAGRVALRKVRGLLKAGADISVISPKASSTLAGLARQKKIRLKIEPFRDSDISDAALIFAATDDNGLNRRIFRAARRKNILINTADSPELCDFIVPAVFREGPLSISVSTDGLSPALSARIKRQLRRNFQGRYRKYFRMIKKRRPELMKEIRDKKARRRTLKSLARKA